MRSTIFLLAVGIVYLRSVAAFENCDFGNPCTIKGVKQCSCFGSCAGETMVFENQPIQFCRDDTPLRSCITHQFAVRSEITSSGRNLLHFGCKCDRPGHSLISKAYGRIKQYHCKKGATPS